MSSYQKFIEEFTEAGTGRFGSGWAWLSLTRDGLKVHSSGNIFTTGPNGILIISPKGVLIATINYGKPITNCNFDTNEEYLYVTGFDDISRIKLK